MVGPGVQKATGYRYNTMRLTEFFDSLVEMEPIKLGGKMKTIPMDDENDIEKSRDFVRSVYSKGQQNPMGRGVFFMIRNDDDTEGMVKLEMMPMTWGVAISEIHVAEGKTGQGFGDYIMGVITAMADEQDVLLSLNAVPLDTEGKKIPKRKLIRFYKKHGFEQEGGGDLMRRTPR